jgi:hypothetical protein
VLHLDTAQFSDIGVRGKKTLTSAFEDAEQDGSTLLFRHTDFTGMPLKLSCETFTPLGHREITAAQLLSRARLC